MGRGRGRKPKLTKKLIEDFVNYFRVGHYTTTVCSLCGITFQTYSNWLKRGEKAKSGLYFEFFESIKKAEAEAEHHLVMNIRKSAAEEAWPASAWLLERRYPEKWGKKQRHEIVGNEKKPLQINTTSSNLKDLSKEELESLARLAKDKYGSAE